MNKNTRTILAITTISLFVFGTVIVRGLFFPPSEDIVEYINIDTASAFELPNSEVSKQIVSSVSQKQEKTPVLSQYKDTQMHLQIPVLDINAKVQEVGITTKGNMAAPNNFSSVGWYKYGAIPGSPGTAVIAGHVNNGLKLPAVFAKLKDINMGDDIYIETADKSRKIHFVVTAIDIYDYDAKNTNVFRQEDGSMLRLITCAGTWVKAFGTHDKRLVVSAKLVS